MLELYNSYATTSTNDGDEPGSGDGSGGGVAGISGESMNQFFDDLGLHQMGDEGKSLVSFFEELHGQSPTGLAFLDWQELMCLFALTQKFPAGGKGGKKGAMSNTEKLETFLESCFEPDALERLQRASVKREQGAGGVVSGGTRTAWR